MQVLGSTFSPGGKVLVVPLGDSIELWDTATGTLRARLMTPEELHVLVYSEAPVAPQIALDATGAVDICDLCLGSQRSQIARGG